ncbi:MAG: DIP1984 family protein [Bacteroidetes bacterium]|nr:DIP1984 family protein [Bacteroidota bacterium]
MKIAEALLLRADIQKKLESFRERITKNVLIQEGEQPSEDPQKMLEEVNSVSEDLRSLVFKINKANLNGKTKFGRSLTEAISERDILTTKHSIVKSAANSATKPPERYGVKEIRWVKTVNVMQLQDDMEKLAKKIREVNSEIQEANWQIEVE